MFEYFNNYLNITETEERTALKEEEAIAACTYFNPYRTL